MKPQNLNKQIEKAKKIADKQAMLFLILFGGMILSYTFLAKWLENNSPEYVWLLWPCIFFIPAFGLAVILKIHKIKAQNFPICPYCNHSWDEISVRIVIATRNCTNCLNEVITLDPAKPKPD